MFTAGIIIFLIGCIVRIWLNLSAHSETKSLSPQKIGERTYAIKLMRDKRILYVWESAVMMTAGALLILLYGVFN